MRITHPFHPWVGQAFPFLSYRHNWGVYRVSFVGPDDRVHSVPADWTDRAPADPFVVLAAGRAVFRPADLLALAALVRESRR